LVLTVFAAYISIKLLPVLRKSGYIDQNNIKRGVQHERIY
jgi:hypothetical protein